MRRRGSEASRAGDRRLPPAPRGEGPAPGTPVEGGGARRGSAGTREMRASDFDYALPESLIAQVPTAERAAARMLAVDGESGALEHLRFRDLPARLASGDLLVLNDTRVVPARLFGRKESGGRVEVLLDRQLDRRHALAHLRASRRPRAGSCIAFGDGYRVRVAGWREALALLELIEGDGFDSLMAREGRLPLPPYIRREVEAIDHERYQTVYAARPGAVAAPTAGLHFDEAVLARLGEAGVETACITLHVAAGTFAPLRRDLVEGQRLHSERVHVSPALCDAVAATRERGGRVVAVGTTSVRALETASLSGRLQPFEGETDLFIRPGFAFRTVQVLLTNFHLPRSTLLMLVCAFGGTRRVLGAYREAVRRTYRFYSYGDAMLVTRAANAAAA